MWKYSICTSRYPLGCIVVVVIFTDNEPSAKKNRSISPPAFVVVGIAKGSATAAAAGGEGR